MSTLRILKVGICAILTAVLTGCSYGTISRVDGSKPNESAVSAVSSNIESTKAQESADSSTSTKSETTNQSSSTHSTVNDIIPAEETYDLFDYTYQVGSLKVSLPCTVGDLTKQGWVIATETVVVSEEYARFFLVKDGSAINCTAEVTPTEPLEDNSVIYCMEMHSYDLNELFASYCGLVVGEATYQDMVSKFGEPQYTSDNDFYSTYEYYRDEKRFLDEYVHFSFQDDILQSFRIQVPQENEILPTVPFTPSMDPSTSSSDIPQSGSTSRTSCTLGEFQQVGDIKFFEVTSVYGDSFTSIVRYEFENDQLSASSVTIIKGTENNLTKILTALEDAGEYSRDSVIGEDAFETTDTGWELSMGTEALAGMTEGLSPEQIYALMQLSMAEPMG